MLIKAIKNETASAKSFVLEALDGWTLDYDPGQFITLVFETPFGEKRRSYSFSSTPNEAAQITVKEVANGEFSRWMLRHLKVGDILLSSGVGGFFQLKKTEQNVKQYCFLAAGSGITPCFSLIKHLLVTTQAKLSLIYSNPSESQTIFYEELKLLQNRYPGRFQIKFLFSTSNDIYSKRLSRWLLDQLIPTLLGKDSATTEYYLCGPFEYMQMAEIALRMYTEPHRIHKENFSHLPRLVLPEPPDKNLHRVDIHLGNKHYSFDVQFPKSVLAVAKEKGIELPYSCEAGRCGSCIASCRSGQFWMAYNEILTDKEVAEGRVLVCQAYPINGAASLSYD